LLTTIDHLWKDHLLAMDHLREGIGLQGYGQKDPLIEYKKQGYRFFEMMMNQITGDVVRKLFAVQMAPSPSEYQGEDQEDQPSMQYNMSPDGALITAPAGQQHTPRKMPLLDASQSIMRAQRKQMTLGRGVMPSLGSSLNVADSPMAAASAAPTGGMTMTRETPKVGRNETCPCGSGKKYKKCHGT
ncbi:MAG: SEC-C metal-binding domain-containing protein, partial [Bdellovibrionota bacterium]